MMYIYDILLNWQDEKPLDFFEWDVKDDIEQVKKIPIIKVDSKTLTDFYLNEINISTVFLENIYKRTEIYTTTKVDFLNYAVILASKEKAVALEFNKNKKIIARSSLLLEEEAEVLSLVKETNENSIDYEITNALSDDDFLTQEEENIKRYLYNEFLNTNDLARLKFLANELFDKTITGDIKEKLVVSLNNINNNHYKLYNLLKKMSSFKLV